MRKKSSKNKTLVCNRYENEFQASEAAKSSKNIKGWIFCYFGTLVLNEWLSVHKEAFRSKRLTSGFSGRILLGSLDTTTGRNPTRIQQDHEAVARGGRFGSNLMLTKTCHFIGVRPFLIKQT